MRPDILKFLNQKKNHKGDYEQLCIIKKNKKYKDEENRKLIQKYSSLNAKNGESLNDQYFNKCIYLARYLLLRSIENSELIKASLKGPIYKMIQDQKVALHNISSVPLINIKLTSTKSVNVKKIVIT